MTPAIQEIFAQSDITSLTDEDLDSLRLAVINEKERRERLANAASQVATIAQRYAEDGGDPADLVAAVTPDQT